MAVGVAHDFNNILAVIKSVCKLSFLNLDKRGPLYRNLKEIDYNAQLSPVKKC